MQRIKDLFQRDIGRKIEEVIKVEQADEETVKNEIEEYIATDSIKNHFSRILEAYNEARTTLTEGIGVWVSGFFGSGKSSFAKILGYSLANRKILKETASSLFIRQVQDDRIKNLLTIINQTIPTHAVIFDVSMDRGVRTSNERITEVMYKALLRELNYAEDFDLADLEIGLEEDELLKDFEKRFEQRYGQPWRKRRKIGRALNEASAILHEMDPETYPLADSWVKGIGQGRADISANLLAQRAFELMARREPGKALLFVIDEVGQYISRSVDKMLDLQAVVQAFGVEGKNRVKAKKAVAPAWIVVTSQEKLDEVVDALGSKKIELARLQDRFPIHIDLAPADIAEVTCKRVLQKNTQAETLLGQLFEKHSGRLNTFCKLERSSRPSQVDKKGFIDFYPYLPHFIDLSIDIMSGIRSQPGAQRHIGGSNRTIIKQAQQMLIHERTNLGEQPVGRLVSLDLIYELVESNLSSEKRADLHAIATRFKDDPWCARVAKAICLLEFVRDLPRTPANIAAVLYHSLDADANLPHVQKALEKLEKKQYVRETQEGYKLMTAQEKNWTTERRGLDPRPAERNRIKREVVADIFSDPRLKTYRYQAIKNFRTGVVVDQERVGDEGDIPFFVTLADTPEDFSKECDGTGKQSRDNPRELFLVVPLTEEIHSLIEELFRSREMINKYERLAAQGKLSPEESHCLQDEKATRDRLQRTLRSKMMEATQNSRVFFQGVGKELCELGRDLPEALKALLDQHILDIYPKLKLGACKLTGKEPEQILTAANLNGLPAVFYDGPDGKNLVVKQDGKYVPNPQAEIAQEVLGYIQRQHDYGEKVTGKTLEAHFGGGDYGWDRDVLRLVLATLFRAGTIEVTSGGQRFKNYQDPNARQPFINNTLFKSASFAPRETLNLKIVTEAAQNYEKLTGQEIDYEEGTIATALKQLAEKEWEDALRLQEQLRSAGLPGLEGVEEYVAGLRTIRNGDPEDVVKMLASEGVSFVEARQRVHKMKQALTDEALTTLHRARQTLQHKVPVLQSKGVDDELPQWRRDLQDNLHSDTFYERLTDIARLNDNLGKLYEQTYSELHDERTKAYDQAIEQIKGHPDWPAIPAESQNQILQPLLRRRCETLTLEGDGVVCQKCRAGFGQMESDLAAVSGLLAKAQQEIARLTSDEDERIEVVHLSRFFQGAVASEADFLERLEAFKDHVQKLLARGVKVIIQ